MIRTLVAEDILPLRRKLEKALMADPEIELLPGAASGYESVILAGLHKPDVVLMDIEMETHTAGILASRQILEKLPGTRIVIQTVYQEDEMIFEAYAAGVSDYVLKSATPHEFLQAIKAAYHGVSPIRPAIAAKVRDEFQRVKRIERSLLYTLNNLMRLTPTEMQILHQMVLGMTRAEICAERVIEASTLKVHLRSIVSKFSAGSMAEIVEQLREQNIFELLSDYRGGKAAGREA